MATGENISTSLIEGLPDIIADARIRAEFEGIWARVTTRERQEEGTGMNWTRTILEKLEAQDITETTDNRNFQRWTASQITGTPQMTQIVTKVTDRFYRKQAKVVSGKVGTLTGNAMARKKDKDFLAMFALYNAATSPGAGNPFGSSYINAAVNRIDTNTSEPGMGPKHTVIRGEMMYDLQEEALAPVGTYEITTGMTAETYRKGFRGAVSGSNVWVDDNIETFGTTNARGATFAQSAAIALLSMTLKKETDRDIYFGGGADVLSLVDEYAFIEEAPGFHSYQHVADATAPTG